MKVKLVWIGYMVILLVAFTVGSRIAKLTEKVLPKPKPGVYTIKTSSKVDNGMKLDVQRFAIETVNKRGDKKLPTLVGKITATEDIKKGTVQDVTLQTTPDLIKAPSRKFGVGAYAYPDKPYIGISYEIVTLGDILQFCNINPNGQLYDIGISLGLTQKSPVLTASYTLSPLFNVFVGTGSYNGQGCTVYGAGIRF